MTAPSRLRTFAVSLIGKFSQVPYGVTIIALASFFMNMSSVVITILGPHMVHKLTHQDLTNNDLHKNDGITATIRAVVDAISYLVKLVSGSFSDKIGNRKLLIVMGYLIASCSKPLFGKTKSMTIFILVYIIERIANGMRDTPRDAMVADLTPPQSRGLCFGIRQGFATAGSTIGALACILLLYNYKFKEDDIFLVAAIPAFLASLILIFFLKDSRPTATQKSTGSGLLSWIKDIFSALTIKTSDFSQFDWKFWLFMISVITFMFGRWSDTFMIMRSNHLQAPNWFPAVLTFVFYLFYSMTNYFYGLFVNNNNRSKFLICGSIFFLIHSWIVIDAVSLKNLIIAAIFYGMSYGSTVANFNTMTSQLSPSHVRGTALGILNLMCALGTLVANSVAGALWKHQLYNYSLIFSATSIMIAIIIFSQLKPSTES